MKEIISIPNASRTFEALRSLGYDLNSSIADVVDNSITDKVDADKVSVNFSFSANDTIVCRISDNGCGMNERELEEAMRLGTETTYEEKDLGKFGMGMKTASLSHCNVLTVVSKKKQGDICGFRWDIGHVKKKGWTLLQLANSDITMLLKKENLEIESSGTIVFWDDIFWLDEQLKSYRNEKLKNNFFYRLVENVKIHLGMVYHRFLDGSAGKESIKEIIVNGDKVMPWDPFCRNEENTSKVSLKREIAELKIPGYDTPVTIDAYIVPNKEAFSSEQAWRAAKGLLSWNDSQGYYIYRANRIIRFGGWQGTKAKDEHDKLARLSIDIDPNLDQLFRITVNKSKVQFPELLYQHLKNVVNPLVIKKAKAAYNKSGEPLRVQNSFRRNKSQVAEISKELIEESNIRTTHYGNTHDDLVEVLNPSGSWLSNKIHDFLRYGGENDFEIISDRMEEDCLWKIVCDDRSKFKVIVNANHPFYERFYNATTNKALTDGIDALIFSLAFAELYCKNNQNAGLFDTYKSVCSQALRRLVTKEAI